MKDFKKIIMPGTVPVGARMRKFHIKIEYKEGCLSLSGVIGAMSNGHCYGSCGQCVDELDNVQTPAQGWDAEMIGRLKKVWEYWHLNDMRAECEHQTALGWRDKAREKVTIYHWEMTLEALKLQQKAEKAATDAPKDGKTFTPTQEQTFLASLLYSLTTHTAELPANTAQYYEPKKSFYEDDTGHTEVKTLGWLTPEEHPEGLLSAVCPVCGYKRGHGWKREEVPEDVLQWLYGLPTAATACAWKL